MKQISLEATCLIVIITIIMTLVLQSYFNSKEHDIDMQEVEEIMEQTLEGEYFDYINENTTLKTAYAYYTSYKPLTENIVKNTIRGICR